MQTGEKKSNKHWVALSSLLCAVALTGSKIIVGVLTGSLGILAEAAHSALDMLAAGMTCLAIRWSSRPADREHHFGHGKIESLSAFLEALMLLGTCVWIVWGAIKRLFFQDVEVDANYWSFGVIVFSIIIDVSRSRALRKASIEHNSQALEADALHFETDIWSSCAVLIGLACVWVGVKFPAVGWLKNGDAIAALAVAVIAGSVTWRLTMRTVSALTDAAPAELDAQIRKTVEALPGVLNCHRVRVRVSGPETFVDLHIALAGDPTLTQAHELTEHVERAVRALVPQADVVVHPEPADHAKPATPPAQAN